MGEGTGLALNQEATDETPNAQAVERPGRSMSIERKSISNLADLTTFTAGANGKIPTFF
jgi:hypothetical protein